MQSSEFKEMLRSTKGARQFRNDGYVNLLNRYGTSRDSSEAYQYIGEGHVPDQTFTNHYATDGLFAKIIDIPAQEAVKKGFKLNIEDEKIEEYIQKEITKLGFMDTVEKGLKWARLYGGALGVMIIDDGEEDLAKPVNWDAVKGIDEIMVFERAEVTPDYNSLYRGYGSIGLRKGSNFTMPEYYNVFSVYGSFRVHESRCLVFRNGIMPERTMDQEYRFWGIPEYNRIKRALRETVTAHSDAVKMLERMVQPIYKMKGLSQLLSTDAGEDNVLKRLDLVDKSRGILNSIAIDSENEDYDFKEASITGVKEVVDSTCNMLSALTEIPQTKLFGRSPAGMNATGDSDLENYYNFVDKIRETQVKGNLLYVVDAIIKIALNTGKLAEKPEYELEFEPLWNESESDKADVEQRKAQTDMVLAQTAQLYIDMGILDPSEERARLCKEGKFGITSEELPEQESSPLDAIFGQMDHADAEEKPIERKTVAVIVVKDGEVLMGERTDNGKLCGPGGHIEDGETLEEAAAREAREEFGIEVKNFMPVGRVTDLGEGYEKPFIFVSKDFLGTPLKYTSEMKNIAFRQPSEDNLGSLYEPFEKSLELLVRGGNYPEISGNFTQNLFTNDEKNDKISIENTDNADGEKDYNTGKEIARWIRVNGAAIPLDKDGNALGNSELKGENFSEAKSEEGSGGSEDKTGEAKKTESSNTPNQNENNGGGEVGKTAEAQNESEGGEAEEEYVPPKRPADVNGPAHTNEYIDSYFKSHPGEEQKIREEARQYTDVLDAVKHFNDHFTDKGDATYDMKTGDTINLENGYSVTFHQNHSAKDPFADYTDENYSIMCAIAVRELGSESVYIGNYEGSVEVSFHCIDEAKSEEFMEIHNQKSIYNNVTGKLIRNTETYDSRTNPTRTVNKEGNE